MKKLSIDILDSFIKYNNNNENTMKIFISLTKKHIFFKLNNYNNDLKNAIINNFNIEDKIILNNGVNLIINNDKKTVYKKHNFKKIYAIKLESNNGLDIFYNSNVGINTFINLLKVIFIDNSHDIIKNLSDL